MSRSSRVACVLAAVGLLLFVVPAHADEIRMKDGEVIHGRIVEGEPGRRLEIETGAGLRRLRRKEIEEIVPGIGPQAEIAVAEGALEAGDAAGRADLARFAWSRRYDDEARRLAEAAIAIRPDEEAAHRLLGHVRTDGDWRAGWPAPWPPAGTPGPRWGTRPTEAKAVGAALAWLAAHQDENGVLDADGFDAHCPDGDRCEGKGGGHHGERMRCAFDGVTTALAVMAWSADGSTPVAGPYADHVRRGLAACVGIARAPPRGFDGIWNHAFAAQAVADVCLTARDPELLDVLTRAVEHLTARQLADGGWSYVYGMGDVPTTAVVLMTLGACAQAGAGVDPEVVDHALAFLDARVEAATGRSEYHDGAELKGYTPTTANAAAHLAARAAVGKLTDAPHVGKQIGAVTRKKPRWKLEMKEVKTKDGRTVKAQIGNLYPYAWYLTAFALERRGGASWSSWGGALRKALVAGQVKAGHARGSWDPLGTYSSSGGRAFVTGMAALMLRASYRWPPRRP